MFFMREKCVKMCWIWVKFFILLISLLLHLLRCCFFAAIKVVFTWKIYNQSHKKGIRQQEYTLNNFFLLFFFTFTDIGCLISFSSSFFSFQNFLFVQNTTKKMKRKRSVKIRCLHSSTDLFLRKLIPLEKSANAAARREVSFLLYSTFSLRFHNFDKLLFSVFREIRPFFENFRKLKLS